MGAPADIHEDLLPQIFRTNPTTATPYELLRTDRPFLFNYTLYPATHAAITVGTANEINYRKHVESAGSIDVILDMEFNDTTEMTITVKFSDQNTVSDGTAEDDMKSDLALASVVNGNPATLQERIFSPAEVTVPKALWNTLLGGRGLVVMNFLVPAAKFIQVFLKDTSAVDPTTNYADIHGINIVAGQGIS